MDFVNLDRQYEVLKDDINTRINNVIKHNHFINGPEVQELENTLADFVGSKHCIGVSSGTHSLELALRVIGVGFGDEVITVPFSWISTAEVISLVGATPIFVDVHPETFLIDCEKISKHITKKTKAIIAVSLFGQLPDFEKLNIISRKFNIPIIEDAAQSFGAEQKGIKSCNFADISCTSFFPAKPLGGYGDGGAIFTNNDTYAESLFMLRNHGALVRHDHRIIGTNARLDTLQAAIILAKFKIFQQEIERRIEIASIYNNFFSNYNMAPQIAENNLHIYSQYTLKFNNRINVINHLNKNSIPFGIYYPKPIHFQLAYSSLNLLMGSYPNTERVSEEVLSIPLNPYLRLDEINNVIEVFRVYLDKCVKE
jgi:UDP-2-acetamido-2-deoxy-ribo-hexuluronate aminotransferase